MLFCLVIVDALWRADPSSEEFLSRGDYPFKTQVIFWSAALPPYALSSSHLLPTSLFLILYIFKLPFLLIFLLCLFVFSFALPFPLHSPVSTSYYCPLYLFSPRHSVLILLTFFSTTFSFSVPPSLTWPLQLCLQCLKRLSTVRAGVRYSTGLGFLLDTLGRETTLKYNVVNCRLLPVVKTGDNCQHTQRIKGYILSTYHTLNNMNCTKLHRTSFMPHNSFTSSYIIII